MTTGINKTFYWAVQRDQESEKDNKYGGILLDWILTQVSCVEERNEVFWSDNQWFFWRERIEKGLLKSLGLDPMPPRTPLNVRCVGTVEREGYRIEKLILEPRPFLSLVLNHPSNEGAGNNRCIPGETTEVLTFWILSFYRVL